MSKTKTFLLGPSVDKRRQLMIHSGVVDRLKRGASPCCQPIISQTPFSLRPHNTQRHRLYYLPNSSQPISSIFCRSK